MAAIVHTGPELKTKSNCQIGQKFLLTVGGGRRLVGCGQISLASNSKANGLNEAILSQVVHIIVLNKLIPLRDVKKLIALPSKAIIGCSIMVGHME